jgi:hypothetical protein
MGKIDFFYGSPVAIPLSILTGPVAEVPIGRFFLLGWEAINT